MSNTRTLTAANAQIALAVDTIFPVPVLMSGFATNNIFRFSDTSTVQTSMGVDGRLSAGFAYVAKPWTISLKGDSLSVDFFESVISQQEAALTTYAFSGVIDAPALQKSAIMTRGFLTSNSVFNSADAMFGDRSFTITWERIVIVPLAA